MTTEEKLLKLRKLSDAMYYAAQNLTTDASRLHKAMEEYHQFIIHECKEEPVSEDLADAAITAADEDMQGRQIMEESNEKRQLYSRIFRRGFKAGAKWQKEQLIKDAADGVITFDYYKDDKAYGCVAHDSFCLEDRGLRDTDKVKMILIKE